MADGRVEEVGEGERFGKCVRVEDDDAG